MKKIKFLFYFLFFTNITFSQNYYFSQWTKSLVVGNNIFSITTGTSNTNWTPGIQAITPELLSNSVTIHNGSNVISVQIIKVSTTEFIINVGSPISNAIITAQYPGKLVCNSPILQSAVRSTTDNTQVTYTWNNNGMTFNTINLQYSTDGGVTWIGNSGSFTSPRTITVPCNANTVRIIGYANGCISSGLISNTLNLSTCCTPPTLQSAVRSTIDNTQVTYTWNNNGMNFSTIGLQYSTDGGATWTSNSGASTSPRTITVPCTANIVRIIGYANGCISSGLISNTLNLSTCCTPPTLQSAVRSTTDNTQVTYTWNNNGINFSTIGLQYSTDGGATWYSTMGSAVSPRIISIPCLNNVLARLVAFSSICSSTGVFSNVISISNCGSTNSGYTFQATQAIGNFANYTSPTVNTCGSVCGTFGSTNLMCYLLSNVSPNSPIGAQIYFKDPSGNYIPANSTNCSLYGSSNGTNCNKIENGIRWVRFAASTNYNIYNVNPTTGIVESLYGICQ